jgi:hypothetical protein
MVFSVLKHITQNTVMVEEISRFRRRRRRRRMHAS